MMMVNQQGDTPVIEDVHHSNSDHSESDEGSSDNNEPENQSPSCRVLLPSSGGFACTDSGVTD